MSVIGDHEKMDVVILRDLTEDEARTLVSVMTRTFPAVSLAARVSRGQPCENNGLTAQVRYELVAEQGDVEMYGHDIERLIAKALPKRLRLGNVEEKIWRLLREMIETGSYEYRCAPESALCRICLLFEYELVPALIPHGDIVDGFVPEVVRPRAQGVSVEGRCWFMGRSGRELEGPFAAELALDGGEAPCRLVLEFGDPVTLAARRIMGRNSPPVTEHDAFGYRVTVRSGAPETDGERNYAFRIAKLPPC